MTIKYETALQMAGQTDLTIARVTPEGLKP